MIHAKELRIGNLVGFYKSKLSAIQVGTISEIAFQQSEHELYHVTVKEFGEIPISVTGIAPIPLTEEWLLRFGFEHIQFAYNFNESDWRIFKIVGFCVGEKDGKFAWYNEADDDYYSTYYPIFLHVHHLQNFYFAYSQKELEIKNPSSTIADKGQLS